MSDVWLVPVILYWAAMAVYFGGFERDLLGGSYFRQFIGVILTYVIFLVLWWLVHRAVGEETVIGVLVASAVCAFLIPIEARIGFLLVGSHIRRSSMAAH